MQNYLHLNAGIWSDFVLKLDYQLDLLRTRDHGLLVVGAGDNALRLLPPLTVSESEIDEAMAAIEAVAGELEAAA